MEWNYVFKTYRSTQINRQINLISLHFKLSMSMIAINPFCSCHSLLTNGISCFLNITNESYWITHVDNNLKCTITCLKSVLMPPQFYGLTVNNGQWWVGWSNPTIITMIRIYMNWQVWSFASASLTCPCVGL